MVRAICALTFKGFSDVGGSVKHSGHYSKRTRKSLEASFLWHIKGCFRKAFIVKNELEEEVSTYRELSRRPHLEHQEALLWVYVPVLKISGSFGKTEGRCNRAPDISTIDTITEVPFKP